MSSWHWVWLEALEHVFLFLYQLQVRRHNDSGMYDDANKASQRAILYVKIGILFGSISWVISGFLSFVSTIAGYVLSAVASAQEAALEAD